jgi:hypothetical protein
MMTKIHSVQNCQPLTTQGTNPAGKNSPEVPLIMAGKKWKRSSESSRRCDFHVGFRNELKTSQALQVFVRLFRLYRVYTIKHDWDESLPFSP